MYGHNSDYEDRGGMYARNSDRGGMFMMKHRANSMSASTSTSALNPEDVWFVDFSASNHIVEYQCIMVVFTLSSLIAQVRAISVISIKGSCPK